ncbi:hypothetical protein ACLKA7_013665 [Drosophila subpalustris]
MHSLKNFLKLSSSSEKCLHLSTKSSLWINSCWELRNKARKLDLIEKSKRSSSFDRLFYKPRPISQRSYSRTWLNKIDSATDSMIAQHKDRTQHRLIYKSIPKYEPVCVDYEPQGKQGISPVKNISAKDKRSLGTAQPNSCWELRKEARKANMIFHHSSSDRQVLDNAPISSMSNSSGRRRNLRSTIAERMDRKHYKPKSLKDRTYERTWDDYGEQTKVVSVPPPTDTIPKHPPVRRRNLRIKSLITKPQEKSYQKLMNMILEDRNLPHFP